MVREAHRGAAMLDVGQVITELTDEFQTLLFEVDELTRIFQETDFLAQQSEILLGHRPNFPNAHHGYLMVCLSKIDFLSSLYTGQVGSRGQTLRMKQFIDKYLYPGRREEQDVAVQLFRHTLIHTGKLRFLYSKKYRAKYTWRVDWFDLPSVRPHFTILLEDEVYQDQLASISIPGFPAKPAYKSLNVSLSQLTIDLKGSVDVYLTELANSSQLQANYIRAMREIEIQEIH
jgi:hypothetical protein